MAEHLSQETLTRYEGRRLSPGELLAADDHLATCAACRARLEERSEAVAIVQSLRAESAAATDHPDYEQLEAVVDGTADEAGREIVTHHTQDCAACADELRELMALRDQLRLRSEKRTDASQIVSQSPPTQEHVEPAPVVSLRERQQRREAQRRSRAWLPPWAAAAAVLAVCALAVWLVWRPSQTVEIAESGKNPDVTDPTPVGPPTDAGQATTNNNTAPGSTVIQPPAPSSAVVALNDGARQVTLDANGQLVGFDNLRPEAAQAVRLALERQRVEAPAGLATITENAGTLMSGTGDGISFKLVSPIATVVESTRPTFRWQPLDGATRYVVKIFDAGFNRVAMSEPQTTTTWTPREPLAAGAIYSWQVTATKDGNQVSSPAPPAPQARFKVIERTKRDELRRAAESYPDSHLLRGVLYARAGLLDDAERELQALLKANPSSDAARRLLASVRALRQRK